MQIKVGYAYQNRKGLTWLVLKIIDGFNYECKVIKTDREMTNSSYHLNDRGTFYPTVFNNGWNEIQMTKLAKIYHGVKDV